MKKRKFPEKKRKESSVLDVFTFIEGGIRRLTLPAHPPFKGKPAIDFCRAFVDDFDLKDHVIVDCSHVQEDPDYVTDRLIGLHKRLYDRGGVVLYSLSDVMYAQFSHEGMLSYFHIEPTQEKALERMIEIIDKQSKRTLACVRT